MFVKPSCLPLSPNKLEQLELLGAREFLGARTESASSASDATDASDASLASLAFIASLASIASFTSIAPIVLKASTFAPSLF